MQPLKAVVFDVDGTLANTEKDGHRVAFNLAFKEHNLSWYWNIELYGKLLKISGGKERIKYFINSNNLEFSNVDELYKTLHKTKTNHYLKLLHAGKISLRNGVRELLLEAKNQNIILAIATTTTFENVTVLLDTQLGKEASNWFKTISAGDVVAHKKPAPDIYNYVLKTLELNPDQCIALEDSNNGLMSALKADLKTVVITNNYTKNEDFTKASLVINKYGNSREPFIVKSGNNFKQNFLNLELLQKICNSQ